MVLVAMSGGGSGLTSMRGPTAAATPDMKTLSYGVPSQGALEELATNPRLQGLNMAPKHRGPATHDANDPYWSQGFEGLENDSRVDPDAPCAQLQVDGRTDGTDADYMQRYRAQELVGNPLGVTIEANEPILGPPQPAKTRALAHEYAAPPFKPLPRPIRAAAQPSVAVPAVVPAEATEKAKPLSLLQRSSNHIRGTLYDLSNLQSLPVEGGVVAKVKFACTRDSRAWTWGGLFLMLLLLIFLIVAITLAVRGSRRPAQPMRLSGGMRSLRDVGNRLENLPALQAGTLPLIDIRD
jgi:hypothetical protein